MILFFLHYCTVYKERNYLFKTKETPIKKLSNIRKYSQVVVIVWCQGYLNKINIFNLLHTQFKYNTNNSVYVVSETMRFSHHTRVSGFTLFP